MKEMQSQEELERTRAKIADDLRRHQERERAHVRESETVTLHDGGGRPLREVRTYDWDGICLHCNRPGIHTHTYSHGEII